MSAGHDQMERRLGRVSSGVVRVDEHVVAAAGLHSDASRWRLLQSRPVLNGSECRAICARAHVGWKLNPVEVRAASMLDVLRVTAADPAREVDDRAERHCVLTCGTEETLWSA